MKTRRNRLSVLLTGLASAALAAAAAAAPVMAATGGQTPGSSTGSEGQTVETAKEWAETHGDDALDGPAAQSEGAGVYEFPDTKTSGTVTVVKKWDDQSTNMERPRADVSISTQKPSKNPLGYTMTFHADAEKGLTFADGSTENDVVYNSSGQIVSGVYKGLAGGSGVVRWYTDKTYQTRIELDENGQPTGTLAGDVDAWPKEVTFEIKGWNNQGKNEFHDAIPDTVTTVIFTDEIMPADAAFIDVDADGDGGVVAWTEENGTVMKVSTQIKGIKVQSVPCQEQMFNNKKNIQAIDFTNFDTNKITTMSKMFSNCKNLTQLDLLSFDTANVTSMSNMFYSCSGLTSLDLSAFDTAKVTNMYSMFSGCGKLTNLDVSAFDTAKVTNMDSMFEGCSGLTSLDVSKFDTANVTSMYCMFMGCTRLTSLDVSAFNTAKVTLMASMFRRCSNIASLNLSGWDTGKTIYMTGMFDGCSTISTLDLSNFSFQNVQSVSDVEDYGTSSSNGAMFRNCTSLKEIHLPTNKQLKVTNISGLFYGDSSLISVNLSCFDTRETTTMDRLFSGCQNLKNVNIECLDTSKITSMAGVFYKCKGLNNLDLSQMDTSNVTYMGDMFYGCSGLTSLDLSNFNTANVTNMGTMFRYCSGLTDLDLSNFNTANVTDMYNMFSDCTALTTLTTGVNFRFAGPDYSLSGTWRNTAGETFTTGKFPSNVADTYTRVS